MVTGQDDFRNELDNFDGEYPESWIPKPGDMLVGKLARYSSGHTSYGEQLIAVIEDDETQTPRSVWLMHTVLHGEFKKLRPKPGERVGIKRLQDSEKGYARYVVRVDREEPVPDFQAFEPPGSTIEDQKEEVEEEEASFAGIKNDKLPEPPGGITDDDIPF